jgi:hypothetical protein
MARPASPFNAGRRFMAAFLYELAPSAARAFAGCEQLTVCGLQRIPAVRLVKRR